CAGVAPVSGQQSIFGGTEPSGDRHGVAPLARCLEGRRGYGGALTDAAGRAHGGAGVRNHRLGAGPRHRARPGRGRQRRTVRSAALGGSKMAETQFTQALVDELDDEALAGPVERCLDSSTARIRAWEIEALGIGIGNPVSVGVYRVSGTAEDRGAVIPWSLV